MHERWSEVWVCADGECEDNAFICHENIKAAGDQYSGRSELQVISTAGEQIGHSIHARLEAFVEYVKGGTRSVIDPFAMGSRSSPDAHGVQPRTHTHTRRFIDRFVQMMCLTAAVAVVVNVKVDVIDISWRPRGSARVGAGARARPRRRRPTLARPPAPAGARGRVRERAAFRRSPRGLTPLSARARRDQGHPSLATMCRWRVRRWSE